MELTLACEIRTNTSIMLYIAFILKEHVLRLSS